MSDADDDVSVAQECLEGIRCSECAAYLTEPGTNKVEAAGHPRLCSGCKREARNAKYGRGKGKKR